MKVLHIEIKYCNDCPYYKPNITLTGYRCVWNELQSIGLGKYHPFKKVPATCPLPDKEEPRKCHCSKCTGLKDI